MSKLCKYCGAEMDDEAFECPECLARFPGAEMLAKQKKQEKQQKIKRRIITCGAAALAIALITGVVVFVKSVFSTPQERYMKPVDTFIKGCVNNDYDRYISAFPEYYGEFLSEQFAYVFMGELPEDDDKVRTADILYLDSYYQELTKTYGLNFDITYDILKEKQYTAEELETFQTEYRSYNSDMLGNVNFEDGYSLIVDFNIKGNLGVNTIRDENFMVFQIDGKWYMMSVIDLFYEEEETSIENYR